MPTDDPIEVAARALRRRDRSRHDVADRLARAGVDEAAREQALDTLERIGYVDDERFATSRAAALAARGQGDAAIRDDLERQGIAGEAAAAALAALQPEHERAAGIVERLGRSARTAGRLLRAGFAADMVEELIGEPDDLAAEGESAGRTSSGAEDPTVV